MSKIYSLFLGCYKCPSFSMACILKTGHPLSMFRIDMYNHVPVPINILQLRKAIEVEWDNIPQGTA
jgi:hypothetical protein